MITVSSGRISTQALISATLPSCACASPKLKANAAPPPARADTLRNSLREVMRLLFLGAVDGGADARIGAAAADAGHRLVDVLVARMRVAPQQRHRSHDLAALAIAALRHLVIDPRLLHRV